MTNMHHDLCVIGLGYVGMPLLRAAVGKGLRCCGVDTSEDVVARLNNGSSHVDDLTDGQVQNMLEQGFFATSDPSVIGNSKTVIICVPTPLAEAGGPDLGAVGAAGETIQRYLRPGTLVILESTTWPGTTEEFLLPILQRSGLRAGQDFNLAFSPERIDPGNRQFGIENTPKVVGGLTDTCRERAEAFYGQFIGDVVLARGTREAEMAKLLENTYRQVNIALVNEMAKFSKELGIDIWDVIRCASTKPFGFQPFYPGPGVGGHCIPIDPSYLSHRVQAELGYPFHFVELAQEVNRSMPAYVAQRVQKLLNDFSKPVRGSEVLLLGVTYKPGIADQRESPALPLAAALHELGAVLRFYDPYVEVWATETGRLQRVADLRRALDSADVVVHLQPHTAYGRSLLEGITTPILDARGTLHGQHVDRL